MKISKDHVVSLAITLRDDKGEVLESSEESGPLEYLHGYDDLVPGLEAALEGLSVGDKKEVKVPPEEGYGVYDASLVAVVPREEFPVDQEMEVGMQVFGETEDDDEVPFWVSAMDDEKVTLDGNHPLAGAELHFSVEVLSIRAAEADELEHGHVHGPDSIH